MITTSGILLWVATFALGWWLASKWEEIKMAAMIDLDYAYIEMEPEKETVLIHFGTKGKKYVPKAWINVDESSGIVSVPVWWAKENGLV